MRINWKSCHTISVVIPTLNEEKKIYSSVRKILSSPHVNEVIVVDGGSEDRTAELAQRAGAAVLVHDKPYYAGGGRGGQIKAGIIHASGDVAAIVHADTSVPSKLFRRMITALNSRYSLIGGAVGCRFKNGGGFKLRIIEFLNDARAIFFNISFGDQVQFFRREPVVLYDIFPDMPLMEDVEFSIRMNSFGGQVFLFGRACVSSRRWQRLGVKNSIMIISLFMQYIVKRFFIAKKNQSSLKLNTADFYKKYYF
ncbi:MAG: glycosyltransferase [Desulfamplus sp.]